LQGGSLRRKGKIREILERDTPGREFKSKGKRGNYLRRKRHRPSKKVGSV